MLPDGVLPRPVVLREPVIHDEHDRGSMPVRVGKQAPAQQRYAHCREEVSNDSGDRCQVHVCALGRHIPLDHKCLVVVGATGGTQAGDSRRGNPGQLIEAGKNLAIEFVDLHLLLILLLRKRVGGGRHVVRPVSKIDRAHLLKAAQQQARRGEQHEGDGDLHHHQRRSETRVTSAF